MKILATLLISFLSFNSLQAQSYFYLDNITISPDPPTSADEICVTISGNKATPCVYLEPDSGLAEVDGNLVLTMCFQDAPCIQVLEPWDTTYCYGFLEPGPFTLELAGCNYVGLGNVYEDEVVGGNANPFADFTNDVSFGCTDLAVNFTSSSENADVFEWTFGDGGISTEQNPTHIYTQPGLYTVTLTVYNSADPDNVSTAEYIDWIQVFDEMIVELGEDVSLPVDGMIELVAINNISADVEYLWSDGSTEPTLLVNAADLVPGSSNTYTVTLTYGNCTATDEVTVFVDDPNSTRDQILEESLFYPNPTADILYFLNTEVVTMRAYDLHGKLIGEWSNTNTIHVNNLATGVYLMECITAKGVQFGRFLKI